MKHLTAYCSLLIVFCMLNACKKPLPESPDIPYGYEYYPIQVGNWHTYQVHEIVWNSFYNTVDTLHYQIKDSVESIVDVTDRDTLYRVECYQRNLDNEPWQLTHVIGITKSRTTLRLTQDNLSYCKLVFPLMATSQWNEYTAIDSALFYQTHYATTGIINNNVKNTNAQVSAYHTDVNINNHTYSHCVSVCLHQFASLINEDTETEIYAPQAGLIYQKIIHTESKASGGVFHIYNGYIKEISIIDYAR